MSNKINNTLDRGVLIEGVTSGMAFAFLHDTGKEYVTVSPLSCCKDYLNEVVFTENTGIGSQAFGFKYPEKKGVFKKKAYLAIKILGRHRGDSYSYGPSIETDRKHLANNYLHIESLLHYFEEKLKMKERTEITKDKDDMFLVAAPLDWTKSTPAISLYTLLMRVALVYDGKVEPMKFLNSYSYNGYDSGLLKDALKKWEHILKAKTLPDQPKFDETAAKNYRSSPHNHGIVHYQPT